MFDFRITTSQRTLFYITLLFCLCCFYATSGATDTSHMVNGTLKDDYGNLVDETSIVKYRSIGGGPVRSSQCSKCIGDGGIRSFYDSAKRFAHFVGPGDYPYDLIDKVYDGKYSDVTSDYQKLIKDYIGIVICVAIGILFILVFPIVGICFCCCRCCGNCGGSRKTDGMAKEGYARPCMIVSLFILMWFVIAGGALLLSSNDSISDGIQSIQEDVPANLDSLVEFFNDTSEVINKVATVDLDFTRKVIFRDLDNIGFLMGSVVRDNMTKETKESIDTIRDHVWEMDKALSSLGQKLNDINSQIGFVGNNITAYADAMKPIQTLYKATSGKNSPPIDTSIDSSQLSTFDGKSQIQDVGNLTEKLEDSLKEVDKIPEQVHNESKKSVSDLKKSILDYTSSVTDNTDDLDFADKVETDDIKADVADYTDKAMKYDKYRKYAGQGLGAIVLLIALLLLLGLIFGTFGSSGSTLPHQRGCGSNSGGNFLIASVALTFVFGSLLMLMTTLLFVVGTPVEDYVCGALDDTKILDKLIDDYELMGSVDGTGNYLGDKVLGDPNKNMTVTEVLSACKNNEAMYKAFRINESDLFNITEILDYKSKFSVEDDLSTINVDFSKIKILTANLESKLTDFNNSIQYNFTKYTSELQKNPIDEAEKFKTTVKAEEASAAGSSKAKYQQIIHDIDTVLNVQGKDLKESMGILERQITDLDNTLNSPKTSISGKIASVKNAMKKLDDDLITVGPNSLKAGIDFFTKRVFGIVDRFIDRLLHALNNDIGQCLPVWNTYNSLLIDNLCGTLVASLNGFWFALGWSLFFLMPSIIVAVKLAKYFRTMKLDDSSARFLPSDDPLEMKAIPDSKPPPMFTNKVAPYQAMIQGRERWRI